VAAGRASQVLDGHDAFLNAIHASVTTTIGSDTEGVRSANPDAITASTTIFAVGEDSTLCAWTTTTVPADTGYTLRWRTCRDEGSGALSASPLTILRSTFDTKVLSTSGPAAALIHAVRSRSKRAN
jgi:hypothetical protein